MDYFCRGNDNKIKMKQKVLYFVPDCPIAGAAGNITRFKKILHYFNQLENSEVDFVSLSDWGDWNSATIKRFREKYPNINLILITRKRNKKDLIKLWLLYKIPNAFFKLIKGTSIDISNPFLNRRFTKILNSKKYDKVIISYASWGSLIDNIKYKSHLIVDTHDFITGQMKSKKRKIGQFFQDEIHILNKFDEIWTYSTEEEYIFDQFTDKKVTLIPISFPNHTSEENKLEYEYDIIFVGSNNPHNIRGIHWFYREVIPHLGDVKVHIIGKVCKDTPNHPNFIKHGIVDSLDHFYQNTKITICPMLSGTGIKIKVLEALSYSLPVVTNRRGIDGLLNKTDNGCIVCENGKNFAKAIEKLLTNHQYLYEKKKEASIYFLKNHIEEKEKPILDKIFKNEK